MELRITGSVNAVVTAPTIRHQTNVLGWAHRFECTRVTNVTGITQGVSLHRLGHVQVRGPVIAQGQDLRITWTGQTCNVYTR